MGDSADVACGIYPGYPRMGVPRLTHVRTVDPKNDKLKTSENSYKSLPHPG